MMDRGRRADALHAIGGAALVGSAFAHWVRSGPGHTLRGHDLVDTVASLGDTLPGLSGARLVLCWYAIPALGATSWIVLGLWGREHRSARVVAVAACLAVAAVVVAFARALGVGALGPGPLLAIAGAVGLLATAPPSIRTRFRARGTGAHSGST